MDKHRFNIVCNSVDTSSFTGNTYNANYGVSLNILVPEDKMNKIYKVSFRVKTATSIYILPNETYKINLNITSRGFSQSNLATDYTLGILSKSLDDVTNNLLSIDTKPNDNPPFTIQSLDRINNIGIRFLINETNLSYLNLPNYILVLYFEEV